MRAMSVDGDEVQSATPRDRDAMARAACLIQNRIDGVSPMQQLLSVPARWQLDGEKCAAPSASLPRLQSRRRRGIAPVYPHAECFEGMSAGTLVVFPAGMVLEPEDRRHPCTNICRSSILSATFYRDAFDVTLSCGRRMIVRTHSVEQVDSIFQACFWNAMG